MRAENKQRLERTERVMVIWICVLSLTNRVSSVEFNAKVNIVGATDVVEHSRPVTSL